MALPPVDADDLDRLVQALPAADWQALAGTQVFIAGGTGYVGCWLLELLLHVNDRLGLCLRAFVLSRQPAAFREKAPHLAGHPAVQLVQGDIRDTSGLDIRCDYLVHAAADVERPGSDPVSAFDAIVQGTRGALALARRSGCRRLLHVSSGAVYGTQPPHIERAAEDQPSAPEGGDSRAAYGLGKRVSEWLADQEALAGGPEVVHARLYAVVGAYIPLRAHFAAGNFLADAAAGRAVRVAGDGTAVRSYLYAGDAAAWLVALLLRGAPSTAYNVGSEQAVSIGELAHAIADLAGVPVEIADRRPARGPAPRYVPATARARNALGLLQYTDLPEALQRSWHWVRQLPCQTGAPGA